MVKTLTSSIVTGWYYFYTQNSYEKIFPVLRGCVSIDLTLRDDGNPIKKSLRAGSRFPYTNLWHVCGAVRTGQSYRLWIGKELVLAPLHALSWRPRPGSDRWIPGYLGTRPPELLGARLPCRASWGSGVSHSYGCASGGKQRETGTIFFVPSALRISQSYPSPSISRSFTGWTIPCNCSLSLRYEWTATGRTNLGANKYPASHKHSTTWANSSRKCHFSTKPGDIHCSSDDHWDSSDFGHPKTPKILKTKLPSPCLFICTGKFRKGFRSLNSIGRRHLHFSFSPTALFHCNKNICRGD